MFSVKFNLMNMWKSIKKMLMKWEIFLKSVKNFIIWLFFFLKKCEINKKIKFLWKCKKYVK